MANAGNRGFGFPEQQGGSSRISPTTGTGTRTEESSPGGVVGTLKEKAQDVASTLGSTAESAWEGTQQAASAVAGTAEEAWDSVISCMSRYPLATFCTGIGLGFLLARALGNTSMTRTMRSWLPFLRRACRRPGAQSQGGGARGFGTFGDGNDGDLIRRPQRKARRTEYWGTRFPDWQR